MTIQLNDFIVNLQGRQYLPVAPRIAAMRDEHPDWSIVTEVVPGGELIRATVADGEGRILATAHKTVTAFRGGAVEKAETGAVGRALALAGYGTLQALELDEGDEIADAPVEAPRPAAKAAPKAETPDGWRDRVKAAEGDARALAALWKAVAAEPNTYRRAHAQAAIASAFAPAITARAADGMTKAAHAGALAMLADMGVTLADKGQPAKAADALEAADALVKRAYAEVEGVAVEVTP